MKNPKDKISMELDLATVSRITTSLVVNIERHIKSQSPQVIVRKYIEIAEQFNDVLKANNLDHYTNDKFEMFECYANSTCNK